MLQRLYRERRPKPKVQMSSTTAVTRTNTASASMRSAIPEQTPAIIRSSPRVSAGRDFGWLNREYPLFRPLPRCSFQHPHLTAPLSQGNYFVRKMLKAAITKRTGRWKGTGTLNRQGSTHGRRNAYRGSSSGRRRCIQWNSRVHPQVKSQKPGAGSSAQSCGINHTTDQPKHRYSTAEISGAGTPRTIRQLRR